MGRLVLATLVSAVLSFFGGFVYWGLLDYSSNAFEPLPGGSLGAGAINMGLQETGWYLHPAAPQYDSEPTPEERAEDQKKWQEAMEAGPVVIISYQKDGGTSMGMTMGLGFAHFLVCSVLLVILASLSRADVGGRFLIVFVACLFGTVFHDFGGMIWWHMPSQFPVVNGIYHLGNGVLNAFVIALLVGGPKKVEA